MNDIERVEFGIKFGIIAGIAYILFEYIPIFKHLNNGGEFNAKQIVFWILYFVILLLLTFGIYKKSRIANIVLLIIVVISKIRIFIETPISEFAKLFSFQNLLVPFFLVISLISICKFNKLKNKNE